MQGSQGSTPALPDVRVGEQIVGCIVSSPRPITSSPRVLNGVDRGRNWDRKDNSYFSLDWRLQRPIRVGRVSEIIPSVEMFNTFKKRPGTLSRAFLLFQAPRLI
jgi:hypothetical protein